MHTSCKYLLKNQFPLKPRCFIKSKIVRAHLKPMLMNWLGIPINKNKGNHFNVNGYKNRNKMIHYFKNQFYEYGNLKIRLRQFIGPKVCKGELQTGASGNAMETDVAQ